MIVEQKGEDVELTCECGIVLIKDCNMAKLFCTLFDISGEQYSEEEMSEWGFVEK